MFSRINGAVFCYVYNLWGFLCCSYILDVLFLVIKIILKNTFLFILLLLLLGFWNNKKKTKKKHVFIFLVSVTDTKIEWPKRSRTMQLQLTIHFYNHVRLFNGMLKAKIWKYSKAHRLHSYSSAYSHNTSENWKDCSLLKNSHSNTDSQTNSEEFHSLLPTVNHFNCYMDKCILKHFWLVRLITVYTCYISSMLCSQ